MLHLMVEENVEDNLVIYRDAHMAVRVHNLSWAHN